MTTPKKKYVVRTEPLRRFMRLAGVSYSELGRRFAVRFGGNETHVVKTMSRDVLDVTWADEFAITLETHPLLVWGEEWEQPLELGGKSSLERVKVA